LRRSRAAKKRALSLGNHDYDAISPFRKVECCLHLIDYWQTAPVCSYGVHIDVCTVGKFKGEVREPVPRSTRIIDCPLWHLRSIGRSAARYMHKIWICLKVFISDLVQLSTRVGTPTTAGAPAVGGFGSACSWAFGSWTWRRGLDCWLGGHLWRFCCGGCRAGGFGRCTFGSGFGSCCAASADGWRSASACRASGVGLAAGGRALSVPPFHSGVDSHLAKGSLDVQGSVGRIPARDSCGATAGSVRIFVYDRLA